jgi:hypothetical protein
MRKVLALGVGALLFSAACGAGSGEETRIVTRALGRADDRPHTFSYTDETLDEALRIEVNGRVEDDFRYAGTVTVNGQELYEMIVSDDAVALRLLHLPALAKVIDLARTVDPNTANALAAGRWVIDQTGAPEPSGAERAAEEDEADEDTTGTTSEEVAVGDDPFFDAADAARYSQELFRGAPGVERFNPEDIEYNPTDDPWAEDAERDLEAEGIRRFDIVQPPLPGRPSRGEAVQPPGVNSFRKMAAYIEAEEVLEVREQISIRDRREFRRAEQGRSADFYLELRDAALRGGTSQPMRERRMTYRIVRFEDVEISLPSDAENGFLVDVIGSRGIKSVFGFRYFGGGPRPLVTESPTPATSPITSPGVSPTGIPAATGVPASSPSPSPSPTTGP